MFFIMLILIIVAAIVIKNQIRKKKEADEQARLAYEEAERKHREERKREEEAERRRQERIRRERKEKEEALKKEISDLFRELSTTFLKTGKFIDANGSFGRLLEMKHSKNPDYIKAWNDCYKDFINYINSSIFDYIKDATSRYESIEMCVSLISVFLKQLKFVEESNKYDPLILEFDELDESLQSGVYVFSTFLELGEENEYGNYKFLVPFDELEMHADDLMAGVERAESHLNSLKSIKKSSDILSLCTKFSECVNDKDFIILLKSLWFYAGKKPFDVSLFERSCNAFRFYTDINECECIEVMLARIYNWKSIGGSSVVMEYQKDILDWVEKLVFKLSDKNKDSCSIAFRSFASGLAWMELYDLELIILKKLVELKVQLWSDAQERLKFLSSGGTATVKIYESTDGVFSFDSSSVDWKDSEYDVFFRKLKMKNIQLNYSLVVKNWTKTYPLQNGQKYSSDKLYHEFESMIEDFDGEVIIRRENASALNLTNVNYPYAVLFHFTSERNRCITMLFHAEKFGRNLNITILTLFTAEKNIPIEELQKYAVAAKNNTYTESFKEAILESLDEVLKTKTTVYDDFEEESGSSKSTVSGFFD